MCRNFSVKHSNDRFRVSIVIICRHVDVTKLIRAFFRCSLRKRQKKQDRISCPYRQVAVSVLKQWMCATAQLNTVQSLGDKKLFSYW